MNGIHDVGGMHGWGDVDIDEPFESFHARWESRIFGINLNAHVLRWYRTDEIRHRIEGLPPSVQVRTGYYERWLLAIERALVDKGILRSDEIAERAREYATDPTRAVPRASDPELRERALRTIRQGVPRLRSAPDPPRFRCGDEVVTTKAVPEGHIRLPGYARGRRGVVQAVEGAFDLPDAVVRGDPDQPQHVYLVRFSARELWGPSGGERESVSLDLWEGYLSPAEER